MKNYPSLIKTWSLLLKIVFIVPYFLLVIISMGTIIHSIMTTALINDNSSSVGCLWAINLNNNYNVTDKIANITCRNYLLGTTLYIPIATPLILLLILYIVTEIILRVDRQIDNINELIKEAYLVIKSINKEYYSKKIRKPIIVRLYILIALLIGFISLFTIGMTIAGVYSHYYRAIYKSILYGAHNDYANRLLNFSNYIISLVDNNTTYWVQITTLFSAFYIFMVIIAELYGMKLVKKKDKQ